MSKKHDFTGIAAMSGEQLTNLLALAQKLAQAKDLNAYKNKLADFTIATMFCEPSTRTRCSFTIAASKLGARIIDIPPTQSSLTKGEGLVDTALSLQAMGVNLLVLRHREDNLINKLAKELDIPIVNAGDGMNEHPSQALLDLLSILLHCGETKNLRIALVGDILHSRVAKSFIAAIGKLGCKELCLVGPAELLPDDFVKTIAKPRVTIERTMEKGLVDADVVMMLRIQHERIKLETKKQDIIKSNVAYFSRYGLSRERLALAKKQAVVMHPGPLNRDVEISSEVADSPSSLILKQVEYGVYARMAIFLSLLDKEHHQKIWGK